MSDLWLRLDIHKDMGESNIRYEELKRAADENGRSRSPSSRPVERTEAKDRQEHTQEYASAGDRYGPAANAGRAGRRDPSAGDPHDPSRDRDDAEAVADVWLRSFASAYAFPPGPPGR